MRYEMTVADKFGVTKEELEAVTSEANRLEAMGYKVPNIEIKFISSGAQGLAGLDTIIIHPNTDLEQIKFVTRHEIGHHNQPTTEFDLWSNKTWEEMNQEDEDFARKTK